MILDRGKAGCLEWAAATRTLPGQVECGDSHAVWVHEGTTLMLVVDGLGHGPEAARAARVALEVAAEPARSATELLERCHLKLRRLRGAAVAAAVLDGRALELTWASVGNVEAAHFSGPGGRERTRLFVRSGIVGHRLPALRDSAVRLRPGDHLVIATDGVSDDCLEALAVGLTVVDAAADLARRFWRADDDGLVLVGRIAEALA